MDPDPCRICRTPAAHAQVLAIAACVFPGPDRGAHPLLPHALTAGFISTTD